MVNIFFAALFYLASFTGYKLLELTDPNVVITYGCITGQIGMLIQRHKRK